MARYDAVALCDCDFNEEFKILDRDNDGYLVLSDLVVATQHTKLQAEVSVSELRVNWRTGFQKFCDCIKSPQSSFCSCFMSGDVLFFNIT